MSSLPSAKVRDNTVRIWSNISELLKNGMFFGANAQQVVEAIGFIESNIVGMKAIKTEEDAAAEAANPPAGEPTPPALAVAPPPDDGPAA